MFKALWFLIKLSLLVAFVIWVVDQPGLVRLELSEYTFSMELGYFLVAACIVALFCIFLYNAVMAFVRLPASYMRYRAIRNREKGYRALTLGLTAVAAGDTKVAAKQARLAGKLLHDDTGLPVLLQAQAARMKGDEEQALKYFAALLENEDAAFLGVRGLLQSALDQEKYGSALALAKQALSLHPHQPWILHLVYDLQVKEGLWNAAMDTVLRMQKLKILEQEDAQNDYTALLLARADDEAELTQHNDALKTLERAFKHHPAFIPAALRLAKTYIDMGKRRKAIKVIEKAWAHDPHPELAKMWRSLIPEKKSGDPMERMKWFAKLHKLNTESARSNLEAGHVAMTEGLWGQARTYLQAAEKDTPSKELYMMLADLERLSGKGPSIARRWLDMAHDAPETRAWVCRETGRIYDHWTPIAEPHGGFNSIEWTIPESTNVKPVPFPLYMQDNLMQAPAA